MNDLDRTTFTKFAERFGRIERQIPAPPALGAVGAAHGRGFARVSVRAGLAAVTIVLMTSLGLAAIGGHPAPSPSGSPAHIGVPPDAAGPAVVFETYLRALQAGDCNTARLLGDPQLLSSSFPDLCTTTKVTAFSIIGDPVVESPYRVRVRADLMTTGFDQGAGAQELVGVYWLQHQSSGAWRISDGVINEPPALVPTLPPPGTSLPAGFLAPFPPQAVVDAMKTRDGIVVTPLSAAELTQVEVDREAAVRTAMASRGIGIPGPDASGEVAWTDVGVVYLANYTAFQLPAYGGPRPSPTPFPAYLIEVVAPPFPEFPGANTALVIIDARSGALEATDGPCALEPCALP